MRNSIIKGVFGLAVAGFAVAVQALTPADVAPQIPEDAQVVVQADITRGLKLPVLQKPEVKAMIEESTKKYAVNLDDYKSMTIGYKDEEVGILFLETPLTPDAIAKKIIEAAVDTSAKTETETIKGVKVTKLNPMTFTETKTATSSSGSGIHEAMYLYQAKPGIVMLGNKAGMEWALKPTKALTAKSAIFSAIPAKNVGNAVLWMGAVPNAETKILLGGAADPSNPMAAMTPDFSKLNAAGSSFTLDGSDYTILSKLEFDNEEEGAKLKSAVGMGIGMLGMQLQDSALVGAIQKAIVVKTAKKACGITVKFNDALIQQLQEAYVKMMTQAAMGGMNFEALEIDE